MSSPDTQIWRRYGVLTLGVLWLVAIVMLAVLYAEYRAVHRERFRIAVVNEILYVIDSQTGVITSFRGGAALQCHDLTLAPEDFTDTDGGDEAEEDQDADAE